MATILLQGMFGGGGTALVVQLVLIVAIMYFLFVMPQRREQKRHREMLAALKPGNQVVTAGGLVGEIVSIREELITLKSGDSRVVVERGRIARLATPPAATK
ncbi:MAG TPA: preprotein translocase subunit YajC [Longimicrobiaceae bacterium]|nr:preprotein translocase subunit YajC [Longimicrobiaceae bacterium]